MPIQAGKDVWSKVLDAEWPEDCLNPNSTYLVEYEPVGSVFEALVRSDFDIMLLFPFP